MVRTLAMALEETNHFLDFCCDIDYVKKILIVALQKVAMSMRTCF